MSDPSPLSYAAVDHSEDPSLCISLMDLMGVVPGVEAIRAEAFALLKLRPGQRVLDLGCGTGDLSRELAGWVAPDGEVTGVDFSRAMVAEANWRQASSDPPVTFEEGDAAHLRFDSATFDACWTERMLCHVPDPTSVLREMARVLRPGGRVVIIDVDTDGTMIDHPDRRITGAFASTMAAQSPNGWIGRQLRRRLTQAGLTDVVLRPKVIELPYLVFEAMVGPVGAALVTSGAISSAAFDAWARDLAAAHAAGTFFMAVNLFIAAATN